MDLDLRDDAIWVERIVFYEQHHGHDENLRVQLMNLLLVQVSVKVDLINQQSALPVGTSALPCSHKPPPHSS